MKKIFAITILIASILLSFFAAFPVDMGIMSFKESIPYLIAAGLLIYFSVEVIQAENEKEKEADDRREIRRTLHQFKKDQDQMDFEVVRSEFFSAAPEKE